MEISKENIRWYIFARFQCGQTANAIHAELQSVFGTSAVSIATVRRWICKFKDGKKDFKDDPRSGAPKAVCNEQTIRLISQALSDDPHVTIRDLADMFGLSVGTVHKIVHEDLHMKKVCSKFVPHLLSPEQKAQRVAFARELLRMFEPQGPKRLTDIITGDETYIRYFGTPAKRFNMQWVHEQDSRPTVLRPGFGDRKRLFTIFFNYAGPLAVDVTPLRQAMTSAHYVGTVLPKVFQAVEEQRPTTGTRNVMLLHDNASCHKSRATTLYLEERNVPVLPHPPYSPDLSPCDYWLFPVLKDRLAGHRFRRIQDMARAVNSELRGIPPEDYRAAIQNYPKRLKMCIRYHGEYFEGS